MNDTGSGPTSGTAVVPARTQAWFAGRRLLAAAAVVLVAFLALGMDLFSYIGFGAGSGAGDYRMSALHLAELISLGSISFGLVLGVVSYPLFIFGKKRTSDRAAVVFKASYRFIFGVGSALIGTLSFEWLAK